MNSSNDSDQPQPAEADPAQTLDSSWPVPADDSLSQAGWSTLAPLPYQAEVRDFLKTELPELWDWFSKTKAQDAYVDSIKFELLKSTYRLDPDSEPELYATARQAAKDLALDIPITIYQAQNPLGVNASICLMVDEAHIVFHGKLTETLSDVERKALLGHELGHLLLWRGWNQEFLVTELILAALTNDPKAQSPHTETARLFQLHVEAFCDRAALACVSDFRDVVAMLVKVSTEISKVNADNYLKQANEVVSKGKLCSQGLTHPETFIRALAVERWHQAASASDQQKANQMIHELIRGELSLKVDLLGQQRLSQLTRRLIDRLLIEPWMQTDLVLAHARAFFDDYQPPQTTHEDPNLVQELQTSDNDLQRYYCYLLLDFIAADRDLEFAPIALVLPWVEQLEVMDLFLEITRKELRLRKKQVAEIQANREALIQAAERQHQSRQREPDVHKEAGARSPVSSGSEAQDQLETPGE